MDLEFGIEAPGDFVNMAPTSSMLILDTYEEYDLRFMPSLFCLALCNFKVELRSIFGWLEFQLGL